MAFQNAISLTDILARIRRDLGEPNSGGRYNDVDLTGWANDAVQDLSTKVDFPVWSLRQNADGTGAQELALQYSIRF